MEHFGQSGAKVWLERYEIEEGPGVGMLSRLAQIAVSLKAPQDLYFTVSKSVAPVPQNSADGIQWDRVSLDSQKVIVTLCHLTLIKEHYWWVEGTIKNVRNFDGRRRNYAGDYGLGLFAKDEPVVVYYNPETGTGRIGFDLQNEPVREMKYIQRRFLVSAKASETDLIYRIESV